MKTTHRKSVSTIAKASGGLIVFGWIFALAGLAMFLGIFARPAMLTLQSRNWVEVPAVIDSAELQTHSGDDGSTYSISVRYHYSYDGRSYSGDRYEFVEVSTSGYDGKRKVVDGLRAGTTVTCYVDPHDPGSSVLNRSSVTLLFGLLPLLFVAAGLVVVRKGVRARSVTQTAISASPGSRPDWLPASNHPSQGALVMLAPQKARLTKFIAIVFFMLFWNGIVSVFIGQGVTFFMVPFVLVGLLLIALTIHQLLSLFNPVIELTVDRAEAKPGERLNLNWNIRGAVGRLKKLKVTLVATESATYRRGTDSVTDRNEFTNVLVYESAMVGPIGAATIEIPSDAMHSFKGANNAIAWKLKIQGEVPRWPDVDDDYELIVIPKGMSHG